MESLFTKAQLQDIAFQAEWDIIQYRHSIGQGQRPSMRTWQKGTSTMTKSTLVEYIRGLWAMFEKERAQNI